MNDIGTSLNAHRIEHLLKLDKMKKEILYMEKIELKKYKKYIKKRQKYLRKLIIITTFEDINIEGYMKEYDYNCELLWYIDLRI